MIQFDSISYHQGESESAPTKRHNVKTLCYNIINMYTINSIYCIYIPVLVDMVCLGYFILKYRQDASFSLFNLTALVLWGRYFQTDSCKFRLSTLF